MAGEIDALVIGHKGQDGSYLMDLLESRGYVVAGFDVQDARSVRCGPIRPVTLTERGDVASLIGEWRPREIYYLAAYHHSAEMERDDDYEVIERSLAVNTIGLLNVLDAMRLHAPEARLFYAASCHLFGDPQEVPQTELTPFQPDNPYAISKLAGLNLARYYRQAHHLYCACGILFNHESPRRPPGFLSRKIATRIAAIKSGHKEHLVLGDLTAQLDWGYAPEYVEAMWRILQLDHPDDFVIATGQLHSVRDFVEAAFAFAGLDWRAHVSEDPAILRSVPRHRPYLGDYGKLHRMTGWRPSTDLAGLARHMVESELSHGRTE